MTLLIFLMLALKYLIMKFFEFLVIALSEYFFIDRTESSKFLIMTIPDVSFNKNTEFFRNDISEVSC